MATYIKGDKIANATLYELFKKNGSYYASLATANEINFEVSALGLGGGNHTLVVKAKADGYEDSDYSNEVVYEVEGGEIPTNLVETVLTINNTGIGAATGTFNDKSYTKGLPYSATTMHCSGFIPVKKGDVITYGLRGAGEWAAVLAFYTSNDVATVVDTVVSVNKDTDVIGTYTCPSDGYIRIANLVDYAAGYSYINGMPASNIASASLTVAGSGIGTGVSTPGGTATTKGGAYSAATMSRSDFIPVNEGDVITYRLRGAGAWAGVFAFYTSNTEASVVDVVASVDATTDVVGTYTCPNNGYIRIANRKDYSAGLLCVNA